MLAERTCLANINHEGEKEDSSGDRKRMNETIENSLSWQSFQCKGGCWKKGSFINNKGTL